jgi:hypothetical protein
LRSSPHRRSARIWFGVIFLAGFAFIGWRVDQLLLFSALGVVPLLLTPITPVSVALYRAWMRLGLLLSHVTSPVLLLIIYLLIITPVALLSRRFGRDPLRLKKLRGAKSYWEPRTPSDPASYLRQY